MSAINVNNLYPYPTPGAADEKLTVSTGVVQLASLAGDTRYVVLDVQNYDVMCTFDGSSPSASNGHHLVAGEKYTWDYRTARAAKFIRQGANDGVIHASQFTL